MPAASGSAIGSIGFSASHRSPRRRELVAPAVDITAGGHHTCALLADGGVRCWGLGFTGALGYGNTAMIGDDEAPSTAGDVQVF